MNRPGRSLCLPVLAAAGLGCVTGVALSGGSGQVRVVRAAGTVAASLPKPTPKSTPRSPAPAAVHHAYPLPKPKGRSKGKAGAKPKPGSHFNLGLGPRGPAGPRGSVGPAGPRGSQGPPGPVSNVVRSLSVNWRNGAFAVDPAATTSLPGLGTATVTCTPQAQTLTIVPAGDGPRTVLATDTAQGAGTQGATAFARATSQSSTAPITVPLPNNGMIFATISVEPYAGDGGAGPEPATMSLSTEWKLNDPNLANNFCFVAAQFVGKP